MDTKLFSLFYGLSFLLSFLLALWLGRVADRRALRKPFFLLFSVLTSSFGLFLYALYALPALALMAFYTMAVFHQQSIVFYNSMLSSFEKRGFTSGVGVAFGYLGSALALLFLVNFLSLPNVFLVVPLIFLLFSLPSFMFLENPKERMEVSLKGMFSDKAFLSFMVALLSLTELAQTLIAMMGVYLRKVYGLEDAQVYRVIGVSALGGVVGGFFWGRLTDRLGSSKVFPWGFSLWVCFVLLLYFSPKSLLLFVGMLAGFSLSHLWTTSRVYLIEHFSRKGVALSMSFLSLTERIASSFGLFLWSLLLYMTGDNYPLSALAMGVLPILGLALFVWGRR